MRRGAEPVTTMGMAIALPRDAKEGRKRKSEGMQAAAGDARFKSELFREREYYENVLELLSVSYAAYVQPCAAKSYSFHYFPYC